jgi:putative acetyltransferase
LVNIDIRNEILPGDAPAIEAVTISAFLNAPHSGHNEQFIVRALRESGQLAVSLVAVAEGAQAEGSVIGHVAASPVSLSEGTPGWCGIGPISVLPAYQGRGVGARLMREALRILRQNGAAGCVVLGEPAYYGRFGFLADPALVFPGVPQEYFQALSFGSSIPRAVVSYHAAFGRRTERTLPLDPPPQ